jgi:hypothetical protein
MHHSFSRKKKKKKIEEKRREEKRKESMHDPRSPSLKQIVGAVGSFK